MVFLCRVFCLYLSTEPHLINSPKCLNTFLLKKKKICEVHLFWFGIGYLHCSAGHSGCKYWMFTLQAQKQTLKILENVDLFFFFLSLLWKNSCSLSQNYTGTWKSERKNIPPLWLNFHLSFWEEGEWGCGEDKTTRERMMVYIDNKNTDFYANSPYCKKVN